MENGQPGDLDHLQDPINVATRELDASRAQALGAVDRALFSLFHAKAYLVAGIWFFMDAYDVLAVNLASVMLGYVYGHTAGPSDRFPRLSPHQDFVIKVAAPIGNLFGQLLFRWLADTLGRKRMYGIELVIIVTATLVQALAGSGPAGSGPAVNIIGVIAFWRFLMGIGVAGGHPLSAVITSEFASKRIRGRLMTTVFTAQCWGTFAASVVALIVVAAYKDSIIVGNTDHVDYCCIFISLGCVPGVIALYFRLTIPETPRFTMDIDRDVRRATLDIRNALSPRDNSAVVDPEPDAVVQHAFAPRRSRSDFMTHFGQWSNLQPLIGVAYSWFAMDVVFYGLGLNSAVILTPEVLTLAGIGDRIDGSLVHTPLGMYQTLRSVAGGNLLVSLAGLLSGYYATFFLVDIWGRRPIQFMGFAMLTVILAVLAGIYPGPSPTSDQEFKTKAFVALYCLATFFTNFGPKVTTFIVPGEKFPTRYGSTAHGIAAASGKLGAIVAQVIFKVYQSDSSLRTVLEIFAGVALTGIASTFLSD